MKIGILTWYKSVNHGAVLQAYATQNYLKENGFNAVLIDYNRQVTDQRSSWLLNYQRVKKVLNGDLKERKHIRMMDKKKREYFNDFISKELICYGDCTQNEYDQVIVGSDMVFSLIQGFNPYMFGIGVNTRKIFSYAASAGGSKLSLAKKMGVESQLKAGLENFSAIGYRDRETLDFIRSLELKVKCVETIDPVLLYGFEKEKITWDSGKWSLSDPYILVYAYHGFMNNKSEVQEIKKFAKKKGLKVISCGYYHSWCDINVNAGPKEFLEMFVHAAYVITDTFHGTVFSIINKKTFVSIIRDNGFKVKYLLECMGLDSRIARTSSEIVDLLNSPVSFDISDKWLEVERRKSGSYLLSNLDEGI